MPEARGVATVVLTRAVEDSASLARELRARGARVLQVPCVQVSPLADTRELAGAVSELTPDDCLVLTSRHGAEAVRAAMGDAPVKAAIAAIGEATASRARTLGLPPAFVSSEASGAALGRMLPLPPGILLLARSDRAGDDLPATLAARGGRVREVVAYRTMAELGGDVDALQEALAEDASRVLIVVASASAVQALVQGMPRARLQATRFVAIGATTAVRVRQDLGVAPRVSERTDEATLLRTIAAALPQEVIA